LVRSLKNPPDITEWAQTGGVNNDSSFMTFTNVHTSLSKKFSSSILPKFRENYILEKARTPKPFKHSLIYLAYSFAGSNSRHLSQCLFAPLLIGICIISQNLSPEE
jgi:hypothetical protein